MIDRLVTQYSIRKEFDRYVQKGRGHSGVDFCIYDPSDPTEPNMIFEGATRLPDNDNDASHQLAEHWCELLSKIRVVLSAADWHVHIDDTDIFWNESGASMI